MADPRMYFRLHDGYTDSPKIVKVGGDAGWLDICAIGYCARNLTDGLIPKGMIGRISDRSNALALARALLAVGRWHEEGHECPRCPQPGPDDYVVHDYLQHQRSAQDVSDLRKKRAEAGARGGRAKAKAVALAKQTPSKSSSKFVAETETETEVKKTSSSSLTQPGGFDEFWSAYPRKESKPAARKAWAPALKKTDLATILAAAKRYATARASQEPQYTKHPATWLNQECWDDAPMPAPANGRYQPYLNPVDDSAYDSWEPQ